MHKNVHDKIQLASKESKRTAYLFFLILLVLFIISTVYTRFNPFEALGQQKEFWRFIFVDFFPPKITGMKQLLDAILQTFYMAVGATGISAVFAFFLAFLGSSSICKSKLANGLIRGFASVLRNIPALVWAFVLVAAFGIGTAVGVLALIIATTGFLIRSFIETLDEVAGENMEALYSTGAGIFSIITQSIIPAALPGYIAWFLYCIETNIRASTILGLVGAGGIGLLMMGYIKQFNYHAACTVIIAVSVIIIAVNLLTDFLRKITIN